MKKILISSIASLLFCGALQAADMKELVVKTSPEMHCQRCENKIKSNIRFVKGTKKINTDLKSQEVSISYDAEKSTVADFEAAFKKIGYNIKVVSNKPIERK